MHHHRTPTAPAAGMGGCTFQDTVFENCTSLGSNLKILTINGFGYTDVEKRSSIS